MQASLSEQCTEQATEVQRMVDAFNSLEKETLLSILALDLNLILIQSQLEEPPKRRSRSFQRTQRVGECGFRI